MWKSVHVYYYDDKRSLLLDAVRPFTERIAPDVDSCYFVLHWLHGSHVRINIDADTAVFDDVVAPALTDIIGGFLRDHPSTAVVDEAKLLLQHQRLAELEHEDGPLHLLPDNSVHEKPYERRVEILGSESAADLLAEFYAASTPIAFDMLEQNPTHGQLVTLSFDLMVATAHTMSEIGLERGFVSFRSHAEAFLSWWPEAEGLRARWDRHYNTHAESLARRVQLIMETADRCEGGPAFVQQWLAVLNPIRARAGDLIARGELSMDPPWAGTFSEDDEVIQELAAKSTFHNNSRPEGQEIDQQWFSRYRLMLNDTYLHMTRLGITPVERFLLCHLAASTAEDLFGTLAQDVRLPAPGDVEALHG